MHTLLAVFLAAGAVGQTTHWPAFLGAGAAPLQPGAIPTEWAPDRNIAWKQTLPGYGQSSPVIWGDAIFTTSVDGASKESLLVACHDLQNGKERWRHEAKSTFPEKNSVYISRAAPTPVVDAQRVYAYFESGDVIALTHDGKPAWKRSLSETFAKPTNEFGLSASPVQTAGHVIILIDDPENSYLVALKKSDGEVAWKQDREPRTSWSSPGLVEVEGVTHVVCSSAGSVDGYSAESGELLWSIDEVGGNTATTPIDLGQGRFLVAASPGRRGENAALARKSNGLVTIRRQDDKWQAEFSWIAKSATPSWASPIAHKGYAYWINRVGAVFCLDVASGKTAYTQRVDDSAWATPVGMGDYVFVFGKNGVTSVLAAGPDFKVVAENRLWSDDDPPVNNLPAADDSSPERARANARFSQPVLYGVAIANNSLVLRTGSMLFCVRKGEE